MSGTRCTVERLESRTFLTGVVAGAEFTVATGPGPGGELETSPYSRALGTDAQGNFVTVYQDADGDRMGVFARRFDAAGQPRGPSFRVNTATAWRQFWPSLDVAPDGSFVVAWTGETFTKSGQQMWDIVARKYAADGTPLTGEIKATAARASQINDDAAVAIDPQGNFVVAWHGPSSSRWTDAVFARRYDSRGAALGPAVVVSSDTGVNYPYADADATGNFVIAYQARDANGFRDVFAQRYGAAGSALGGALRLSQTTAGDQTHPHVELTAQGDFVAAWASDGQDGSGLGAYARRFSAAGAALSAEFQVSPQTTGHQWQSSLDVREDGSFVAGWVDQPLSGADGPARLYARQYDGSASPVADDAIAVAQAPEGQVAARADGGFVAVASGEDPQTNDRVLWGRVYVPDTTTTTATGTPATPFGTASIADSLLSDDPALPA